MSHKRQTSLWTSSGDVPKSHWAFNPTRFALVRKRLGLTKIGLARELGIGLRSVAAYELGEYPPSDDVLKKLVSISGFPPDFFCGDNLDEPDSASASFRSMARMSSCQRDMALSQGAVALHLNAWVEENFELPAVDVPDLGHGCSPEAAAEALRAHWAIGELPIRNIVHLLESKGVRIFSLAIDAREVDAYSMWNQETPFIFLNGRKSSEHSRYDAAHELGHLVLHRHGGPQGRGAEHEANSFASAFLMPRGSVIANAPRFPTLETLIDLKRIWTTSVAALNHRLHAVGMLSDWQYRTMCIQISQRGYRTKEPNEAPRETSQVLPKIFDAMYEEGITRSDVAHILRIPQCELEQLMFGLAMAAIPGGGKRPSSPRRPHFEVLNNN